MRPTNPDAPTSRDVGWGINNQEQAEEEERTQCENTQARAQAKLMVIALSHAL